MKKQLSCSKTHDRWLMVNGSKLFTGLLVSGFAVLLISAVTGFSRVKDGNSGGWETVGGGVLVSIVLFSCAAVVRGKVTTLAKGLQQTLPK